MAAHEEMSLEKLMGHATDFILLKMKEMKVKQTNIKVDDLANDLHEKLRLTGSRAQSLQIDDKPLDPVTPDGKQYGQMRNIGEAKAFFMSKKRRRGYGGQVGKKDGSIAASAPTDILPTQSTRLMTKITARKKLPVTIDDENNQIIEWDKIPDKIV